MDTETVSPDHSAPSVEVEKEEAKKMGAEIVAPSAKGSEESPCAAPESEAKVVEAPVMKEEDLKCSEADVKPEVVSTDPVEVKGVELPPPPAEVAESAEVNVDDKTVELPPPPPAEVAGLADTEVADKPVELAEVAELEDAKVDDDKTVELPPPQAEVADTKVADKPVELAELAELNDEKVELAAPPTAEVAESTEFKVDDDKPVELSPPPAEVDESTEAKVDDDKPVELPPPPAEVAESAEAKVDEDKPVELPPPPAEPKESEVDKKAVPPSNAQDASVVTDSDKSTQEVAQPSIGTAEIKSEAEDTNVEPIEEKSEETAKVYGDPVSLPAEVIDVKEDTPKESTEDKDVIAPEAETKLPELSESPPVVEEKKENLEPEPLDKVEVKSPADVVEGAKLPEKDETCPVESPDEIKSETPVIQVTEKNVESVEGKETLEVTGLSEEKAVEPEKTEADTAVPEVKNVVAEELVQCEEKPTEAAISSASQPDQLAEEVAKDEATSRDIELVSDKGTNKDETVSSVGTANDESETKKETEKVEAAEKIEETVQAAEDKLEEVKQVVEKIDETPLATEDKEEEKQVNEPEKIDVQNPECTKDFEETKTFQDVPREDVPVKKQSFVKIMKQSLVKAKKAIIRKSQNVKTPASEPKDDGNK